MEKIETLSVKVSVEVGTGYSWGHALELPEVYVKESFELIAENLEGCVVEQLRAAYTDHLNRLEEKKEEAAKDAD